MDDCIFCKIINGELPSTAVYEDDAVYAFRDIKPMAPVHVVAVPKRHITSLNEVDVSNIDIVVRLVQAIPEIAGAAGVRGDGYRVISNVGENGGQTVPHLHFHILGGKKLRTDIV